MQDVFDFRNRLIDEYSAFSRSFSKIAAADLAAKFEDEYSRGRYWTEPLIQINPNYKRSGTVQELVKQGSLHAACAALFQVGKVEGTPADLHLYVHQMQAIAKAQHQQSYVVTTGTGSGKSLSFFIPVIDRILKSKQAGPSPGDDNAVLLRNSLLHNIGNLTLLTAKLNPSLSNSNFSVKRPEITKSLLALNAHFQAPAFAGSDALWDEACIKARALSLFAVATSIWPYGAPKSLAT